MDGDEEVSMPWGLWFRIGRHRKPHWEGDIQATESEGERQVPPRETHSEQRGKCNISQVGRCLKCSQEKPKRQEENPESHVLEAKWNKKKKGNNTQCFTEEGYMDGASAEVDGENWELKMATGLGHVEPQTITDREVLVEWLKEQRMWPQRFDRRNGRQKSDSKTGDSKDFHCKGKARSKTVTRRDGGVKKLRNVIIWLHRHLSREGKWTMRKETAEALQESVRAWVGLALTRRGSARPQQQRGRQVGAGAPRCVGVRRGHGLSFLFASIFSVE